MRPFDYRAPTSIDEAIALINEANGRARPIAGGTDLLVQLRRRLFDVDLVIDVKQIPELNALAFDPATGLIVGAAVPCARICEHLQVSSHYPCLVDAASIIGGTAIQQRATVGGNLCNAAPSGDTIPALIVLDAACVIAGPAGARTVPVRAFCTAPGQTVLRRGEILASIHLPPPTPGSGAHYLRFIPRHEMDIAVVGVGAWVVLQEGRISDARIALGAVAPTPLSVDDAAAALIGRGPSEDAYADAARQAQEAACPIDDVRGSIAQRRHLVGVLTKRALRGAVARARGGSHG
jgi:CO/xanthine dehydrogenase FAD-binding subunit